MEEILSNLRRGKALWLGLFLSLEDVDSSGVGDFMPTDAHVTVAYYGSGSKVSDGVVRDIYLSLCAGVIRQSWRYSLTGFGEFTDGPVVALVNSHEICTLAHVVRSLTPADREFGFIPHVTLTAKKIPGVRLNSRPRHLARLSLVCGDARCVVA